MQVQKLGRRAFLRLLSILLLPTVLVASCALPARLATQAIATRPSLLVATWNMNAGQGDFARLLDDLTGGGPVGDAPADVVVLLQEAVAEKRDVLERLAAERGWFMLFAPAHFDGRRTRGNAILASRPLLDARTIPLPHERQPRNAAAATIDVAGTSLFLASVHLENRTSWWKGGLFSGAARGRQAAALIDALPQDQPGIVGGDLNTWLGPSENAWRLLARRFDDTPAFARIPTFRRSLVLDHLLYDLPRGWTADSRVAADAYGSDHHPVVAAITVGRY